MEKKKKKSIHYNTFINVKNTKIKSFVGMFRYFTGKKRAKILQDCCSLDVFALCFVNIPKKPSDITEQKYIYKTQTRK